MTDLPRRQCRSDRNGTGPTASPQVPSQAKGRYVEGSSDIVIAGPIESSVHPIQVGEDFSSNQVVGIVGMLVWC